ncbi:MAG TPA: ABC transporter permease [Actinomycetota bacterium]|nr:ABC transporter permease [Actinomycetota bacterium]
MNVRATDRGAWRLVARRDLSVRLRDRGFVISTLITITVLTVIILIRAVGGSDAPSFSLGVAGASAGPSDVAEAAASVGRSIGVEVDVRRFDDERAAEAALLAGEVDAVLQGDELVGVRDVPDRLEQVVQAAAIGSRLRETLDEYDVPPAVRSDLADQAPIGVRTLEPHDPDRDENGALALIAVVLLYGQLFGYGIWIATGVIEEKSSRVVEILLSAIGPRQLMAGKIVGIGLLGLGQLAVIAIYAIVLARLTGALELPGEAIGVALLSIGWFLLGFAFYAGLFAVAGSLVSRMEELQNAMTPINLVIFVSLFISIGALQDPDGSLPRIASFLPTSSALAMPVRIVLGSATTSEVALSIAIVVLCAAALIPVSARLYAGAILRIGARVKLRDAWRSSRTG